MDLDRLESESALNLRERSLVGAQEDRDIVEEVFVDQAGGCQGGGEEEAPDAYGPAAGLRFESCDFGDCILRNARGAPQRARLSWGLRPQNRSAIE